MIRPLASKLTTAVLVPSLKDAAEYCSSAQVNVHPASAASPKTAPRGSAIVKLLSSRGKVGIALAIVSGGSGGFIVSRNTALDPPPTGAAKYGLWPVTAVVTAPIW